MTDGGQMDEGFTLMLACKAVWSIKVSGLARGSV